ncbi:sensor histidine kinase [Rhodobacteraceae bacterium nBUS_22]|nr:ATP-binding protein [Paracoccaceae bacterium]
MTSESTESTEVPPQPLRSFPWQVRVILAVLFVLAGATLWLTNTILTDRFTQSTQNKAELRLALYGGNILSELQRNSIVPQLLSRDPELIGALNSADFSQSTQRLMSFVEEIGAASLMLLDGEGRTVASTDRNNLGKRHNDQIYFLDALKSNITVFSVAEKDTGEIGFFYSRQVEFQNQPIGVILVEVDLQKFQRAWAGISDAVLVIGSEGKIILATEPKWRGLTETMALRRQPPQNAIERAMRLTSDWASLPADAYVQGEAVMRIDGQIPFRGWQIISFTTYASVREKVNGILALEIMGFALLFVGVFYLSNRRTVLRLMFFQRESEDLRDLNARLQREISEREKVQKTLAVAEQSLAQSSKLAALGEMSAAVSHELNQPLAAMKTYLAGAALLLKRNRPDEALSAFHRIDGLIERMGAITRQLKSYARKGGESFVPLDMAEALASSLSMMEPQLKHSNVRLRQIAPDQSVLVMGDRMRIEQVLINLLRNALDALKTVSDPEIEVILSKGETVTLSVRDNGPGIKDLELLFEPFHTTKEPGDGVGLGLAISSGIVTDLGGRLTARNASDGGAVFEVQLPIFDENKVNSPPVEAAE